MVDRVFTPISPPTSPGMSAFDAASGESEWRSQELKALDPALASTDGALAVLQTEASDFCQDEEKRPTLRSHKSFPFGHQKPSCHPTPFDSANSSPSAQQQQRIEVGILERGMYGSGGSAPASPVSRLTPPSPGEQAESDTQQPSIGDDELVDDLSDFEEPKQPLTAQELRAQKRKMKRFRLTHNQTRFLMSEFARQAHPDAAHRERLAREIPGLSPRQVQVWFQNRRAKLKRLTSDDRERMMRSRALPDDFDMAQALHAPFASSHSAATPLASPGAYSPVFPDLMRPLMIDTMRRDGTHLSPTGISPAFSGFNFTPPQSATDSLSPLSAPGESPFAFPPAPLDTNTTSRRSTNNPFSSSSVTASPNYTSHPQFQRLHSHERVPRSRAESLTSSWRSSMNYTDGGLASPHSTTTNSSYDSSRSNAYPLLPYGLGYSSYSPIPGFQATSSTRMRSLSGTAPRRIELSPHYTHNRPSHHQHHHNHPTTPQTASASVSSSFPNFHSSPLTAFDVPHLSAPHHLQSFPSGFLRGEEFGQVLGEVGDRGCEGESEAHDGSVRF